MNEHGAAGYGLISLIATLPLLLPVGDLGLGAAVTDSVARDGATHPGRVQAVIAVASRRLWIAALVLSIAAIGLAVAGLWAPALGLPRSSGVDVATAACVTVFAFTLPLTLSGRVLLGSGQHHLGVLATSVSAPAGLALTFAAAAVDASLLVLTLAPVTGLLLAQCCAAALARRRTGYRIMTAALKAGSKEAGRHVRRLGAPMLVLNISLPLAYQSDRIVLAHASGIPAVTSYSAVSQLYLPLLSVITAAGLTLWPRFAAARRADGTVAVEGAQLVRLVAAFAGSGLILAISLLAMGTSLVAWTTHNLVQPGVLVFVAFALLLVIHAAHYPSGMLLTDRDGLMFQARACVLMLAVNLPLSWVLAGWIGAAGPVLGSAGAVFLCMGVPCFLRARHLTIRGATANAIAG